MLHYVVFIIFAILLIRNYEKTAILIAALACWLSLFKDPLNSVNNLYLTFSLIIFVWGIFKYGRQLKNAPFLWCIVPVLVSYVCTMSAHGIYLKQFLVLVAQFLFPCVLYCVINSQNRVNQFVKYISGLLILATLYCLVEESISANPIMHWCENNMDSFTWLTDRKEFRFGVKRAQSFFADVAAFGVSCIYAFIVLFTLMRDNEKVMKAKWRKLLIFLLPLCVFLTGTRSIIICFLMACVSLLTLQTVRKYFFQIVAVAFIIMLFMVPYFLSIYSSIFVDSTELGGSSSDMREVQWDIALLYMAQNFWVGNGIHFTGSLLNEGGEAGLFGAEGMWLPIMMDRGMIGVISTLVAFLIGLIVIIRRKQYRFIWIWVSFLVMKTITTGVGIEPTYYEVILVVLFRYTEFSKIAPIRSYAYVHQRKCRILQNP